MRESRLWLRCVIALLVCAVMAFGRTDEAGSTIPAVDPHAAIDCALCHSLVASLDDDVSFSPTQQRCLSCHAATRASVDGFSAAFHGDKTRTCGECHLFHDPSAILVRGRAFAPEEPGKTRPCAACHDRNGALGFLSPGHVLAADLYHSNVPEKVGLTSSETCLLCHDEDGTPPVAGLESVAVPRFDRHRMHPIGQVVQKGEPGRDGRIREEVDPRLKLFDRRIECHTCHQLTNSTQNHLVDLGSPEALCRGCHEFE